MLFFELLRGNTMNKKSQSICGKTARNLRDEGEVCITKIFKPSKDAPRYKKGTIQKDILKARINSAMDMLKKANLELSPEVPHWETIMVKRTIKSKDVWGNVQIQTKEFPQLSRSIYVRGRRKKPTEKAPHLGAIMGRRIGTPDQLYSAEKAQNRYRSNETFKEPNGIPDLSRLVLVKAQKDAQSYDKSERHAMINQYLKAFSEIVAQEKEQYLDVTSDMDKDMINKRIIQHVKDKLLEKELISKDS